MDVLPNFVSTKLTLNSITNRMENLSNNYTKQVLLATFSVFLSLGMFSCGQAQESGQIKSGNSSTIEAPKVAVTEAAYFGNNEAIKAHIAAKSDLNQKDPYGSAPLHIAATFGKTETALLLINGGANINEINNDGSSPLHIAAFFGRVEIVKALLSNNADLTIRNNYKVTALESISSTFEEAKPIYDQMGKLLGPIGLKLNYDELKTNRPIIVQLIKDKK